MPETLHLRRQSVYGTTADGVSLFQVLVAHCRIAFSVALEDYGSHDLSIPSQQRNRLMFTTFCTSCHGTVATNAGFCPRCGSSNPHEGRDAMMAAGALLLLVFCAFGVIGGWSSGKPSDKTATSNLAADKPAQNADITAERTDTNFESSGNSNDDESASDNADQQPESDETGERPLAGGELRPKLAPIDAPATTEGNVRDYKSTSAEQTWLAQIASTMPTSAMGATEQFGDAQLGFAFEAPAGLFVQQHPPDSDGTTMILVSAQGDEYVLLTATKTQTSAATAKELMHEMMRENPAWKYTHKKAKDDAVTLSGFNGGKIFYRRSLLHDGRAIGFCIEYPRSLKSQYNDTVEMLVATFTPQ
jgi:hypothetical protein